MKSENIGTGTLAVEVLNVSPHGFWVLVGAKEYFLDFDQFPWFRHARLEQLFGVELLHGEHLYWPALDVDLELDCIEHPHNYPLLANGQNAGAPAAGGKAE